MPEWGGWRSQWIDGGVPQRRHKKSGERLLLCDYPPATAPPIGLSVVLQIYREDPRVLHQDKWNQGPL